MRIRIAATARRVSEKDLAWAAGIKKALTPAQFKFLKEWVVDGKTSSPKSLALFTQIKARLSKADLMPEEKQETLYRGVNVSTSDFKKFLRSGKLPHRGVVESWTSNASVAARYAEGSMRSTPLPVSIVFKYKKGAAPTVMQLRELANALAAYTGDLAPFNRETVVHPNDMGFENVHLIGGAGLLLPKNGAAFNKMLSDLDKEGLLAFPLSSVTLRKKYGITKSGKLTQKK